MIPGLVVRDLEQRSDPPHSGKINGVLIIAARHEVSRERGFVEPYEIAEVPTEADIEPRMGGLSEAVTDAYRSIKRIAPEAQIFMVVTYVPRGSPVGRFQWLTEQIELPEDLPLCLIVCPELDLYQAAEPLNSFRERMPARRAIARFAQQWGHIYYFNMGTEIMTLADAINVSEYLAYEMHDAVRGGHAAAWYGWGEGNSQPLSLAIDAAAYTIQFNQFQRGVFIPAGERVYTPEPVGDHYRLTLEEAEEVLRRSRFNFAYKTPYGWSFSGDATLGDGLWSHLSIRLAIAIFRQRLANLFAELAFTSMGFEPLSPDAVYRLLQIPLINECQRGLKEQIISAYQVVELSELPRDEARLKVRVKPYGAVDYLDIDLMGES